MIQATNALGDWDLFVLRHHKPSNLLLHFVSAVLFFGSPVYGLVTRDLSWFAWFCLSGCVGSGAHYLTRDGTVTLRQGTSSPRVVAFNLRMWWRLFTGRYASDVVRARALLAHHQTSSGKMALVTGASSGFGEATVRELLGRGFWVIATVRKTAQASIYGDLSAETCARLTVLSIDVTDPTGRAHLANHIAQRGRLDVLVCNAGGGLFGALTDVSETALRQHMEVNFFGAALITRELLPFVQRARGTIVHVSSPAGLLGLPWTSAYCASKHALEGLTESLAYEVAADGVAVHLVTPSAHRTELMRKATWIYPSASPHREAVAAYHTVMERNQKKNLPGPERVARVIADLAERRSVGLRVDIGINVRVLRALVRLLPSWARQWVVSVTFREATRRHVADLTADAAR